MTQEDSKKLFDAIKKDDLTSFCMLTKNSTNISYGRFPLLSICLMYEAKKIVKSYFKILAKIKDFETVPEPFELYLKFKSISKQSLKLYAGQENLIMPIEMLAIQNKDAMVKKYYKIMAKSQKSEEFLRKIYSFHNQSVKIENDKIKISHKKISRKTKIWLITSHSTFAVLASIVACVIVLISNIYGLGTASSPKKILDQQGFLKLSNKSCYATLLDDITLDSDCQLKNFSGEIIGNNKTITINYDYENFIVEMLNGKIKDVNIVFNGNITTEIESDLSLLAKDVTGEILNVNIIVNNPINVTVNGESCFAGFAINNNGYIHDCSIKLNAELTSNSTNDNLATFFANVNNGVISGCEVLSESSMTSTNIDIAGIANQNNKDAEISSCKNNATLSQSSASNLWSLNVGGITNLNFGTISNCTNNGNLSANQTTLIKDNNEIILGGICSQNYSIINHSKNTGNINSNSEVTTIYAGGITAYTGQYNITPVISFCATTGNFDIKKNSDEIFTFCGGISGFLTGTVSDCYSTSTFSQSYDETNKNMIGLLVGASRADFINIYLKFTNTHCLVSSQTTKILAVVYTGMGYSLVDDLPFDVTKHETLQEMQDLDIYW